MNVFDRAAGTAGGRTADPHKASVQWRRSVKTFTRRGGKANSQREDLVPLWVQVLVDRVALQSVVAQLQHAVRVALTCGKCKNG